MLDHTAVAKHTWRYKYSAGKYMRSSLPKKFPNPKTDLVPIRFDSKTVMSFGSSV